jgi:hypothetical protein
MKINWKNHLLSGAAVLLLAASSAVLADTCPGNWTLCSDACGKMGTADAPVTATKCDYTKNVDTSPKSKSMQVTTLCTCSNNKTVTAQGSVSEQ